MNIQDWFPLGLTSWISLLSKGLSRVFSNTTVQNHQLFSTQLSLWSNLHPYWKSLALTIQTFVGKVVSLFFNFKAVVTILSEFRAQENNICYCFQFFPSICHEVMRLDAMILIFWILSFKPAFSLSSFAFIKMHFSSSSLSAIRMVSSVYLRLFVFLPAILIPACESYSPGFHMMYSA